MWSCPYRPITQQATVIQKPLHPQISASTHPGRRASTRHTLSHILLPPTFSVHKKQLLVPSLVLRCINKNPQWVVGRKDNRSIPRKVNLENSKDLVYGNSKMWNSFNYPGGLWTQSYGSSRTPRSFFNSSAYFYKVGEASNLWAELLTHVLKNILPWKGT